MSDLTHIFKVGQAVVWVVDEFDTVTPAKHNGTVTETYPDHIIVDIPAVCDHCYFDHGLLDTLYPAYNFV